MGKVAAFLATLTVTLVACSESSYSDGPLGPRGLNPAAAVVTTTSIRFPVDILVFVPCADGGAGEFVELSGNLHDLFHLMINGNRFVLKVHTQPQGIRGVGLSTGDKYQGTGVTQETLSGSLVNGQFSDTFVNNFRIIGQGPGNNFLVHENLHITVNANGEVTASVGNASVSCK
ncbi:MAG: hypothetical protein ACREK2_02965 [Gemmatimonadota bacterium]